MTEDDSLSGTFNRKAKRIVILGCAGSGKTALALRLGRDLNVPVICLDTIWKPRWTKDDLAEFRALVEKAHGGEGWISDGNFAVASFDIRLPRAELIVSLERTRLVCVWRSIGRVFRSGEAHNLRDLPKVLRFIWNFERVNRPVIETTRTTHGGSLPVIRLTSDLAISDFARSLRRERTERIPS